MFLPCGGSKPPPYDDNHLQLINFFQRYTTKPPALCRRFNFFILLLQPHDIGVGGEVIDRVNEQQLIDILGLDQL